ncbi:rho-related BTB domain-containing protein 1-like [Plakobranchus ocellatus]|uniref:Rho-related BTB domain-containing protein 1-like n=1 Tax=Plakobranchus ocellatus TaxID=259542 RepID=A0AAV4B4V2_9GAST|nr:rho-related BTB domain-containing protein 1-like [Plakobranchus ocellatus]
MVNQALSGFEEIIKCVIVGDSGVGKTCLACSYACNAKYDLRKLVRTHQATVWATDHYQNDKEVLERSWCDLDGCQVSIRLWDTFGYHDKDRRFAYRGADVIVMCFSLLVPNSLRNIRRIWEPEARRLSPNTPIVLCGTQADLRYLCVDEKYINMEKGLLYRNISLNDMIPPSAGREVARDLGAPYYETSVLTQYGVHDVFLNAARVALLERRKIKFWNAQLRRIQRPLIQPPMNFPMPTAPKVKVMLAPSGSEISALVNNRSECDVTFLVDARTFEAHRICLAVASRFFEDLFSLESLAKLPPARRRRKRKSNNSNCYDDEQLRSKFPARFFPSSSVSSEQDHLLPDSDLDSLSTTDTEYESSVGGGVSGSADSGGGVGSGGFLSSGGLSSATGLRRTYQRQFPLVIPYDHPAVETIEIRHEEEEGEVTSKTLKSYIRMNEQISAGAFMVVLEYLYTGSLRPFEVHLDEIRSTAELLQLTDLMVVVDNMKTSQDFLNIEMDKQFHVERIVKIRELAIDRGFLSDISFEVDNGIVLAHKALLMGRCEMMYAMFNNDFIESASDVIPFPGINAETFGALQEYLYTGETPRSLCTDSNKHQEAAVDCVALIELANRLCLPQLMTMVEVAVVEQLQSCYDSREEMLLDAISLVEPAKLYNAKQLLQFCLYTLSTNYTDIMTHHHKLFLMLPPETREQVELKRWPPAWYLKEKDQFERLHQSHTGSKSCKQQTVVVQEYDSRCGCLCFSRRGRHKLRDPVEMPL